ncbi:hypothetical protein FS749_001578 [Ceratobasidium sp. UAMH 11750]|nr:hypothetical protein FS749_001578 [Ceratobasidium sp. UAMH 11750]
MDVPANETNIVKRSLDNWKSKRMLLTTAIQSYLAACTDLNTVCTRAACRTYDRKDLESALAVIDAELEGLAPEAESLYPAIVLLTVTRNLSITLAPIHTLPPEILTRIFMMVPSTRLITQISSYWRQVALNSPSLWTSVGLTNQSCFTTYDYLYLERSGDLPLHFYVLQDDAEGNLEMELEFFKEALPQIQTLDIWTNSRRDLNKTGVASVLKTWLKNSSTAIKELRFEVRSTPKNLNVWSTERAERVLGALTVLHLSDILIPCSSAAYHGLVDLRLSCYWSSDKNKLSVSELAGIFLASPNLSTFKMAYFTVLPSEGSNAAVPLVCLEVLRLWGMEEESMGLVMSLIPLSRCLGELSICLELGGDNLFQIGDFLCGARIKTLACTTVGDQRCWWPLLLSKMIPRLEHLILHGFRSLGPSDIEDLMAGLGVRKAENDLNNELLPHLPHVYLVTSGYDNDDLTFITRMLGVQNLHVEGCWERESQGKLSGLEGKLLEALANFKCTFTEEDTTAEWPCRSMFDGGWNRLDVMD